MLTTSYGTPALMEDPNPYDELVLGQETQVVPIYFVRLDKSKLEAFLTEFERMVPQAHR